MINKEESDKESSKDYVSPTFLDSDFDKMKVHQRAAADPAN